ncbi:MAG: DUF1080 domain-containing protein [Gemmataceae bacterium]|nr:DUF1080 domain-containing protein [Gemmataceae bacterium]
MNATFLVLLLAMGGSDKVQSTRWDFKAEPVGKIPAGWSATQTGKGDGSVWTIVAAKDAPGGAGKALAQTAKSPAAMFNLCVADKSKFKDVDLTVSYKAMAGETDQGGGPLWRYQDSNNYYVTRMNPLEKNFRVYIVFSGKRVQLGSANIEAPTDQWHTIRVVHKGDRIQCYLNGKMLLDVTDDAITQAGKVGLWTKADAQTLFANLQVREQ